MTVGPDEFYKRLEDSGLLNKSIVEQKERLLAAVSGEAAAAALVEKKFLTNFQSEMLVQGKDIPLLIGDYVVTDSIGRGGMGYVLKARHRRMKREVAIKFLLRSLTESDDLRRRFEREVEAAAKLDHQNIVTAYDAGVHDGSHYLVMQYVDGEDLSHLVKVSGPLDIADAIDVIRQAALGLGYAHDRGVIHRDIKPGNLLLDNDGVVRILDMGLARMLPSPGDVLEGGAEADLTNTGSVMGTIDYMAPEQALDAKSVDHRTDIYALGCTLYFLLTSNPPFRNDTVMRRLLAHREQPVPLISEFRRDAPKELDQIFAKMMAKSPDDRFSSMKHLVAALDSLELDSSEAGQIATLDMPGDGNGGFIRLPEGQDFEDSDPQDTIVTPDFSEASIKKARVSAILSVPSESDGSSTDVTQVESGCALQQAELTEQSRKSDRDSTVTNAGDSSVARPPSNEAAGETRAGKKRLSWKIVLAAGLAIVAIILSAVSDPETPDEALKSSPADGTNQPAGASKGASNSGSARDIPTTGELVDRTDAVENATSATTTNADSDVVGSNDGSPIRSAVSTVQSVDRRIAEWVLNQGGRIGFSLGLDIVPLDVRKVEMLPDEPFAVRIVGLAGTQVTDDELISLRELRRLWGLDVSSTQITDHGLAVLTDNGRLPSTIRSLDISRTAITEVGVGNLAGSGKLNLLSGHGSKIARLDTLLDGFPELELLKIARTPISGESLHLLSRASKLTNLEVDSRQMELGGPHVARLTGLKRFGMYGKSPSFDAGIFASMKGLEALTLPRLENQSAWERFWATAKMLPQLRELRLGEYQSGLTSEDFEQFRALPQVEQLTVLHTVADVASITKAVSRFPRLSTLSLEDADLNDVGLEHFSELRQLRNLRLIRCRSLSAEAVQALHDSLPDCRIESDHGIFEAVSR